MSASVVAVPPVPWPCAGARSSSRTGRSSAGSRRPATRPTAAAGTQRLHQLHPLGETPLPRWSPWLQRRAGARPPSGRGSPGSGRGDRGTAGAGLGAAGLQVARSQGIAGQCAVTSAGQIALTAAEMNQFQRQLRVSMERKSAGVIEIGQTRRWCADTMVHQSSSCTMVSPHHGAPDRAITSSTIYTNTNTREKVEV